MAYPHQKENEVGGVAQVRRRPPIAGRAIDETVANQRGRFFGHGFHTRAASFSLHLVKGAANTSESVEDTATEFPGLRAHPSNGMPPFVFARCGAAHDRPLLRPHL